jgi:ABC-type phosphate/phosphonate transport system substrate-binding protein
MYDRPETRAALNRLWHLVRQQVPDAPEALTWDQDPWEVWQNADLLVGQTCGLPFRAQLQYHTHLVGTLCHDLPDCAPGYYHSVIVQHRNPEPHWHRAPFYGPCDRIAVNDVMSQSGWAALIDLAQSYGYEPISDDALQALPPGQAAQFSIGSKTQLGLVLLTGAHRASARAVAERRAVAASLDAVTWALIDRHDAFAADLRVVRRTAPTPGLPLITAFPDRATPLFDAFKAGIAALSEADRATLLLRDIVKVPKPAYTEMPLPPKPTRFA